MKLLWFPENPGSRVNSGQECLPTCRLAVETAIVRRGTPLFLPGWCDAWSGIVGIGVVVERLGRHIDERFAGRYYSLAVLAVKAVPKDLGNVGRECSDALFSLDGSVLVSAPFALSDISKVCDAAGICLNVDSAEVFDSAVSSASRAFTLHTGDIVIAGEACALPLVPDTRLELCVDDCAILSHKIK